MRIFFLSLTLIGLLVPSVATAQTPPEDIASTFEAFWTLFDQRYASFEEKQIDWQKVYQEYRPKVSELQTERELFDLMTDILRPFRDAHINLLARRIDTAFTARRPSRIIEELRPIPSKERRSSFQAMTAQSLRENGFGPLTEIGPEYKGRKLFAYTNNGKVGYLRFTRSFKGGSFFQFWSLNKMLNKIFSTFQGLDGLIIDIRFNMGGNDSFSQKVAGRLIREKTVAYYKQTRKDKAFGPLEAKYIKPRGKATFDNPVVLLTNDKTVSAADVLALISHSLPQITLLGEPSNGSFSDLLSKKLPNKWTITLSHQRYLSTDKVNYEGRGVPVDEKVLDTLQGVQNKKDAVLLKALEKLQSD
ncbi:MAG: S41 family peptidase [Bacteroidota bacterium]